MTDIKKETLKAWAIMGIARPLNDDHLELATAILKLLEERESMEAEIESRNKINKMLCDDTIELIKLAERGIAAKGLLYALEETANDIIYSDDPTHRIVFKFSKAVTRSQKALSEYRKLVSEE